jgi:hypothetical protein
MKLGFAITAGLTATLSFSVGMSSARHDSVNSAFAISPVPASEMGARNVSFAGLTETVHYYCGACHNPQDSAGNLILRDFDVAKANENVVVAEKMIRKLRAQMMPPPRERRPGGDTLLALVETLEQVIDKASDANPGTRTFQRLNRAEYEHAVRDLVGIQIDAGDYLPLDTKSANFDNIADVQLLSPTLLEAYLNAAAAVSRMAVGDANAPSTQSVYLVSPFASQHPWDHVDGTPYGTRGGLVAAHPFPADGQYEFRVNISGGVGTRFEDIDLSIDGERVALLHYERGIARNLASADAPNGADYIRSEPIKISAGQHQVSAAFVRRMDGPYEDLIKPHEWSRASNGTGSAGTTEPPSVIDVMIAGPTNVTGVSESPSRKMVFTCHPAGAAQGVTDLPAAAAAERRACAAEITSRLATKAYRRPLTEHDRASLMAFYDRGAAGGDFDAGIRTALQAILASPYFVFRFETAPANVVAGKDYRITDVDLASRLSFFLWGSLPDDELLALASQNKLSDKKTLEHQVKRMLADPRAEALSTRFAAQWLRLQDVEKVHPDAFLFPDFNLQLAQYMERETELFFDDIVRNDRSVTDLFTADYTFVNDVLARHYGIPKVSGPEFRRVNYPDNTRRGLLGQGSMLVQTSLGNRTSPVLRGKWVMEVLLGMPPPPPPPDVPSLDETKEASGGKPLTTRERMEIHRKNPTCNACHQYMDPMGLALDNFDVTGRWRYRENGAELDTHGKLYDGTAVSSPADLTQALLKRPIPLIRSFTENLMAYALGRRVEVQDEPAVRAIVKEAESKGNRLSSFVLGVVNSNAFQYKRAEAVTDTDPKGQR